MYRCLRDNDHINAHNRLSIQLLCNTAASSQLVRSQFGFTLIELLITIVIVAILAAVAIPSYQSSIRKSHRAIAKTALLDLAAREERYYSTNNSYSMSLSTLGYPVAQVPSASQDYYTVTVGFGSSGDNNTFSLKAAPDFDQAKDTTCYSYELDNTGAQTNWGANNVQIISNTGCW